MSNDDVGKGANLQNQIKIPNRIVSKRNILTKDSVQSNMAEVNKLIDQKLGLDTVHTSLAIESVSQDSLTKIQEVDEQQMEALEVPQVDPSKRRATIATGEIKLFSAKAGKLPKDFKNPHENAPNAQYGDMPMVWAFEVENNMRQAVQDVLRPIVQQNEKSAMNVADLQASFEDLLVSLERVNRKLDLEVRLRDLVTDQSERMKKVQEDVIRFQDNLQKRLQDMRQMYNVHDDRLSRFLEVTQVLETENKQLRRDIREYERLAQDISGHNKEMLQGLELKVGRRLDRLEEDTEALSVHRHNTITFMKKHKAQYKQIFASLGLVSHNYKDYEARIRELGVAEEKVAETEKYLGYILPLQLQSEIYAQVQPLLTRKDQKLTLMENVHERVKELTDELSRQNKKQRVFEKDNEQLARKIWYATFNKTSFKRLGLDEEIKDLKQQIKDEEEDASSLEEDEEEEEEDTFRSSSVNTSLKHKHSESQIDQISRNQQHTRQPSKNTSDSKAKPISSMASERSLSKRELNKERRQARQAAKKKRTRIQEEHDEDDYEESVRSRPVKKSKAKQRQLNMKSEVSEDEDVESDHRRYATVDHRETREYRSRRDHKSLQHKTEAPPLKEDIPRNYLPPRESSKKKQSTIKTRSGSKSRKTEKNPAVTALAESGGSIKKRSKTRKAEPQPMGMQSFGNTSVSSSIQKTKSRRGESGTPAKLKQSGEPQREVTLHESSFDTRQSRHRSPDRHHSPVQLNYQHFREEAGQSKASSNSKMAFELSSINRQIKDLWAAIDAMEKRARQRVERTSRDRPIVEKRIEKQFVIPPGSTKSKERRVKKPPTTGTSSNHTGTRGDKSSVPSSHRGGTTSEERGSLGESREEPVEEEEFSSEEEAHEEGVTVKTIVKMQRHMVENRQNIRDVTERLLDLEKKYNQMQELDLDPNDTRDRQLMQKVSLKGKSMNEIRRSIEEKMYESELLKLEIKNELKRLTKQCFTANTTFIDNIFNRVVANTRRVDDVEKRVQLSDSTMAIIFKLFRIQYALSHQDELDKQDIFLLGTKEEGGKPSKKTEKKFMGHEIPEVVASTPTDPHNLLTFDKNCLSCGGQGTAGSQIPTLTKAFKMACLSYKPSKVSFEGKPFDRNQLVEAQGYLLYLSLRQMQHLDLSQAEKTLLGGTVAAVAGKDTLATNSVNYETSAMSGGGQTSRQIVGQGQTFTDDLAHHLESDQSSRAHHYSMFENFDQIQRNDNSIFTQQDSIHPSTDEPSIQGSPPPVATRIPKRMVSLSKSKEFSKIASQVPNILTVKEGKAVEYSTVMSKFDSKQNLAKLSQTTGFKDDIKKFSSKFKGNFPNIQMPPGANTILQSNRTLKEPAPREDFLTTNRSNMPNHNGGEKLRNQTVYNFNTINVVGSPANLSQIASPTSFMSKRFAQDPTRSGVNTNRQKDRLMSPPTAGSVDGPLKTEFNEHIKVSLSGTSARGGVFAQGKNVLQNRSLVTADGNLKTTRAKLFRGSVNNNILRAEDVSSQNL